MTLVRDPETNNDVIDVLRVVATEPQPLHRRFNEAVRAIASAKESGHLSDEDAGILLRDAISTFMASRFNAMIGQFMPIPNHYSGLIGRRRRLSRL